MLHLGEYLSSAEYAAMREKVIKRVKNGGFFVETVKVGVQTNDLGSKKPGYVMAPYTISITQVTNDDMLGIQYYPEHCPDGKYPKSREELETFVPGINTKEWDEFIL